MEMTLEEIVTERQVIFDTVAKHLSKQGRRAIAVQDGRLLCKYRGPNGAKCAVGCLLKDSEYDPAMEGKSADIINLPERLRPHEQLLRRLQQAHDLRQEGSNCATIQDRLERIAHRWNLDSSILSTLTFPEVWK